MAFPKLSIEPVNINADYIQRVVTNHHVGTAPSGGTVSKITPFRQFSPRLYPR